MVSKMVCRFTQFALLGIACPCLALDGGALQLNTYNGWKAFEVISVGNDVPGDGYAYAMPGTYDGIGAQLVGNSLRIQLNHETSDASVSQIMLDQGNFKTAISTMISSGNTGGVSFVTSAKQAYDRWSANGGASFVATTSNANTSFYRFCSSQSYLPNTFGTDRGFVDNIYLTGEEGGTNRLFALDIDNADFYLLSGHTGAAPGGLGGMPFDAFENAALVDTGETDHVALVLSPDGGTETMSLYIGVKGKDASGNASTDFLARNGLAYGSYYYFHGTPPASAGSSANGTFTNSLTGGFKLTKLEDVDTNPNNPTQVALTDQNFGAFIFDLNLDFTGGSFNTGASGYLVEKIVNQGAGTVGVFQNMDNNDWTEATELNGTAYPDGLIFVNEDSSEGEIWYMLPDGSDQVRIASTIPNTESTGIVDISKLVGYQPGSILLTSNQSGSSSMSVLINPNATLLPVFDPADLDLDGDVDDADFGIAFAAFTGPDNGPSDNPAADLDGDGDVDDADFGIAFAAFTGSGGDGVVPEPTSMAVLGLGGLLIARRRRA